MKRVLFFAALLLVVLLSLIGCAGRRRPTLVYMVDGETYHTDVIETKEEFFGNIGKEPVKEGFLFGGWYYDDGVWEKPLSYTELNKEAEKKEYRVYAKWETVSLAFVEEERAYKVVGLLSGAGSDIVIPATYKDIPVTSIAPGAFRGNKTIKTVTVPDTVKTIGEYAFAECTALEKMLLPNTVTEIGRGAFSNCIKLAELNLGTALVTIKAEAFWNCTRLTTVSFPASIEIIGARAFASSAITSVKLPLKIATVGTEAFAGCPVTEITYAGQMTSWAKVDQENFAKNSSITGVKCLDGTVPVAP